MTSLHFSVADCLYEVVFIDEGTPPHFLLASSEPFFVPYPLSPPLFQLQVGKGLSSSTQQGLQEIGHFPNGGLCHHVWRNSQGGYHFQIDDPRGEVACMMDTSPDFKQCKATLSGDFQRQKFGFQNALMIAFAFASAPKGVLLIHASVPILGDKAYLFQGKSGTGKSTHCQLWLSLWKDAELLNDDNPALRLMEDGRVFVYGTPWSGKTPCYRSERRILGGFLRLCQAPKNEIREHSSVEAFASILSSCSTMLWDTNSYRAICSTINQIVKQSKSFTLECLPNPEAALLSYRYLVSTDESS